MKKNIFLIVATIFLCVQAEDKSFVIVVPSYNNKFWYKRNLDSIFAQRYTNFRVIYIDDCSPDKTGDLVEEYCKLQGYTNITLIKNQTRKHAMANRYHAIHQCRADEIVINIDGDDWLIHANVLAYLNEIYQNPAVWMTHGNHVVYPRFTLGCGKPIPQETKERNTFREFGHIPTLLYSFYAGLFQKIKKEDLMYEGEFLTMAHSAYMYPIIEMSGVHSRFTQEILYVYNQATPLNDNKVDLQLQLFLSSLVKQRPAYQPVSAIDDICAAAVKRGLLPDGAGKRLVQEARFLAHCTKYSPVDSPF